MESLVQMTGVIVAILSLCGVIFNYAVIKPLSSSIEELRELIESTQAYIRGVEEKRQNMAERLAKVEASAASAHHRMDTLEKRMNQ
ncbi:MULTISPECIES: hypothetical protein [Megasphaera]|jgi:chromosome segregation ATPase|nr:hypothetical protein [Megasphaera elsdenii]MCI7200870.1 hypothetical protein [Megasphaera elsdenii]